LLNAPEVSSAIAGLGVRINDLKNRESPKDAYPGHLKLLEESELWGTESQTEG